MGRLLNEIEVAEFKELADGYQPLESVVEQFNASNFVVIAGPAGAGKDTLRNALIDDYPEIYVPIISTTTRPARNDEVEGVTYHFREVEEVRQGLTDRIYFQAALVHNQQVSCLNIDEINKLGTDQIGLSILIPKTIRELKTLKADLPTIFVVPPTLEVLKYRMGQTRNLTNEEIDRRLVAARQELELALVNTDYVCLISDSVERISVSAHQYLQTGERPDQDDAIARATISQIVRELVED